MVSDQVREHVETLRALEAKATPGPWRAVESLHGVERIPTDYWYVVPIGNDGDALEGADAELIAAMRNALPDLLAELASLRTRLAEAERLLRESATRIVELAANQYELTGPTPGEVLPEYRTLADIQAWLSGSAPTTEPRA